MELAKEIIELLTSICFLIGTIVAGYKATMFFSYKHDTEIRKLYINNCKEVRKIMGKIIQTRKADLNDFYQLSSLFQDAVLFLHKDIVAFVREVLTTVNRFEATNMSLKDIFENENNKQETIKQNNLAFDKLCELNKKSFEVYRKHILHDGLGIITSEELLNLKQ